MVTNKQIVVEKMRIRSLPQAKVHENLAAVLHENLPPPKKNSAKSWTS
jgi:hypothetical protein